MAPSTGLPTRGAETSLTRAARFTSLPPRGVVTVLHGFSDPRRPCPNGGWFRAAMAIFTARRSLADQCKLRHCLSGDPRLAIYGSCTVSLRQVNGAQPFGSMIQGRTATSTARLTRRHRVMGTVFQLTPAGVLTTVYNFPTTASNNRRPTQGDISSRQPTDDFYGTTSGGGSNGQRHGLRLDLSVPTQRLHPGLHLHQGHVPHRGHVRRRTCGLLRNDSQ